MHKMTSIILPLCSSSVKPNNPERDCNWCSNKAVIYFVHILHTKANNIRTNTVGKDDLQKLLGCLNSPSVKGSGHYQTNWLIFFHSLLTSKRPTDKLHTSKVRCDAAGAKDRIGNYEGPLCLLVYVYLLTRKSTHYLSGCICSAPTNKDNFLSLFLSLITSLFRQHHHL